VGALRIQRSFSSSPVPGVQPSAAQVRTHIFRFLFLLYILVVSSESIPTLPVYAGKIQGKVLGMAVEILIFDE
jgi:hypothetical protein